MESLNERIKNLRKEKGWTQLQLAEKLSITDKAVSKWEVGEANPDLGLIVNIASLFGVTIDYLLTGKVEEESISLDDMDTTKRLEYLIKKDDVDNFKKYYYNNGQLNSSLFFSEEVMFGNKYKLKAVNIGDWRRLINNDSNKILNLMFDKFVALNSVGICAAVLVLEILPEFIKKAVEYDRSDILECIGLKYLDIGENKLDYHYTGYRNNTHRITGYCKYVGARKTYAIPVPFVNKSEEKIEYYCISQDIIDYIFESADKSPKCYEYLTKVEGKFKFYSDIDSYSNCPLENTIIKSAIKYKKYDVVNNYLEFFNNDLMSLPKRDASYKYSIYNDFLIEHNCPIAKLHNWSQVEIEELIKDHQVDLATSMIEYNKNFVKKCNYFLQGVSNDIVKSVYIIDELKIKRLVELSREDLSADERLLLECVDNHIIVESKLSSLDDIKFIKKVLDDNYCHPMEFVYDALINHKEKELFKYLVDIGLNSDAIELAATDLFDPGHESFIYLIWHTFKTSEYLGVNNKKDFIDKFYDGKMPTLPSNVNFNAYVITNLEDNKIYEYLKKSKYNVLSRVQTRLDNLKEVEEIKKERAKIMNDLPKDYFEDLLNKNQIEMFIIKLCSLFDAILRFDYKCEGEDFFGRMSTYFKSRTPESRTYDDGWGYQVLDVDYENKVVIPWQKKVELFNRLRIRRNNIAHSESNPVKDLSIDELKECLEFVFSNKRED